MTVVVLDTNALPKGHYSDRVLSQLRAVAGRGASLVVPEIVVWEWAEHARVAQEALAETVRHHRVDERLVARPAEPEVPSIEDLISRIESALRGKASIWTPSDGVWRDSVRQQVLQVGTGERKAAVKTGAADAVVLACVEQQVRTAEGAVVLVTNDSRLRETCRAWYSEVLVANGVGQLLPQLNTFEPAEDDLALRAEEDLPLYLNERVGDGMNALALNDLGVAYRAGDFELGPRTEPRLAALHVSHVDIAEIGNFRIARDETNRYGLAELRLFGELAMEIVEQVEIEPGQYAAVPRMVDLQSAHIDVTVAIRWNHNWQLEGIDPTGIAVAVAPSWDQDESGEVPPFAATELRVPTVAGSDA